MTDDAELLRRYAGQGSQAAFTELVQRHIDLVYAAALRRTGDPHRAADVAQQVFTKVAREARSLARHPVLVAWLHTATRNAALNLMISDQRRRAREAEAVARAAVDAGGGASWEQVRPWLDSAIDELPENDRAAVVLRFLERLSYAEIGARLRVSEDAARVRTDRALDKLRAALVRRGVTSTAAALGALVAAQPVVSAPAGLAATVAAQALATGAAATTAFVSFFSAVSAKVFVFGALGAAAMFFTGLYVGADRAPEPATASPEASLAAAQAARQLAALREDNDRLRADAATMQANLLRLTEDNAKLAARAARAPATAPPPTLAMGMSRGEVQNAVLNNLRQIAAARDQYRIENGMHDPPRVQVLIGKEAYIKRITTVDGEDYANLSMEGELLRVKTPGGMEITYDSGDDSHTTRPEFTPEELKQRAVEQRMEALEGAAQKASEAYQAAHNGDRPPNDLAMVPYFANPKERADFVEFLGSRKTGNR